MKKAIVYILALTFLVTAMAGCTNAGNADRPGTTTAPTMTAMPDVNDGVVKDDNGIIDEGDTGVPATQPPTGTTGKATTPPATSMTPNAKPSATTKP